MRWRTILALPVAVNQASTNLATILSFHCCQPCDSWILYCSHTFLRSSFTVVRFLTTRFNPRRLSISSTRFSNRAFFSSEVFNQYNSRSSVEGYLSAPPLSSPLTSFSTNAPIFAFSSTIKEDSHGMWSRASSRRRESTSMRAKFLLGENSPLHVGHERSRGGRDSISARYSQHHQHST